MWLLLFFLRCFCCCFSLYTVFSLSLAIPLMHYKRKWRRLKSRCISLSLSLSCARAYTHTRKHTHKRSRALPLAQQSTLKAQGTLLIQLQLTPSFQPPRGITPMTHTVTQQMVKVARKPLMMLHVANTRTGKAKDTPSAIPRTAFSARD